MSTDQTSDRVPLSSERHRCSHMTRGGRPCRNPAAPGTDPPACARHLDRKPPRLSVGTREHGAVLVDAEAGATDLSGELALVRRVLRRLIARMDEAGPDIPLDELRQIGGLVFAGAKTVAQLLAQQSGEDRDLQSWLAPALEVLADDWGLEL